MNKKMPRRITSKSLSKSRSKRSRKTSRRRSRSRSRGLIPDVLSGISSVTKGVLKDTMKTTKSVTKLPWTSWKRVMKDLHGFTPILDLHWVTWLRNLTDHQVYMIHRLMTDVKKDLKHVGVRILAVPVPSKKGKSLIDYPWDAAEHLLGKNYLKKNFIIFPVKLKIRDSGKHEFALSANKIIKLEHNLLSAAKIKQVRKILRDHFQSAVKMTNRTIHLNLSKQ